MWKLRSACPLRQVACQALVLLNAWFLRDQCNIFLSLHCEQGGCKPSKVMDILVKELSNAFKIKYTPHLIPDKASTHAFSRHILGPDRKGLPLSRSDSQNPYCSGNCDLIVIFWGAEYPVHVWTIYILLDLVHTHC